MRIAAPLFLLVAGCTLYKSSDRDSFNQNALAGVPAATALTKKVGASECWIMGESVSRIEFSRERVLVQERQLLCSFSPESYSSESRVRMIEAGSITSES